MSAGYILRRIGAFLLMVWLASTLNFLLPRLSPINPIQAKLNSELAQGGTVPTGAEEMVKEYNAKFGLDKPLWQQYLIYQSDFLKLDFNYSIANYPMTVLSVMGNALPWSMGLLLTTAIVAFVIGNLLGSLLAWPRAPTFIRQFVFPPFLVLSAVPYYVLGLCLAFFLGFQFHLFPLFGAYTQGILPNWNSLDFWADVIKHAVLPALSIVLSAIGFWALGMRAMMVSIQGEDFMTFAEAKGLKPLTIFLRYGIRNAALPQITALALQLGHVLSGALLVEIVFSYPGIGTALFYAVRGSDYYVIQGIVMGVIVSIGLATLVLDLVYALIDPRITYRRA